MDRTEKRGLTRRAWGYFRDVQTPRWKKLAAVLALAYLFSPVDFVPDVFPVVGWLDDVGVLSAAAMFFYRDVQRWRPLVDSTPQRISGPPQAGERQRQA